MLASVLALAFLLVPADSTATPPDSMLALLMQAVHAYVAPYERAGLKTCSSRRSGPT